MSQDDVGYSLFWVENPEQCTFHFLNKLMNAIPPIKLIPDKFIEKRLWSYPEMPGGNV